MELGGGVGLVLIHIHSKLGWTGMNWDATPSPPIGCQPMIGLGGNCGGCFDVEIIEWNVA